MLTLRCLHDVVGSFRRVEAVARWRPRPAGRRRGRKKGVWPPSTPRKRMPLNFWVPHSRAGERAGLDATRSATTTERCYPVLLLPLLPSTRTAEFSLRLPLRIRNSTKRAKDAIVLACAGELLRPRQEATRLRWLELGSRPTPGNHSPAQINR
jgi:hypothetical protein